MQPLWMPRAEAAWVPHSHVSAMGPISQHKLDGRQRSEQSTREYSVTHSASSLETAEPLSFEQGCPTLDLNLDFQIMNMSPSVQRASSPKCTATYTATGKKSLQLRRFNSNSSLYNDLFHFKLPNALFQRRQQGFGAVN